MYRHIAAGLVSLRNMPLALVTWAATSTSTAVPNNLAKLARTEDAAGRSDTAQRFRHDACILRTKRDAGLVLLRHLLNPKPSGWTDSLLYQQVEQELTRHNSRNS